MDVERSPSAAVRATLRTLRYAAHMVTRRDFLAGALALPTAGLLGCSMRSQPPPMTPAPPTRRIGITDLHLLTVKLAEQRTFYADVLGVPVVDDPSGAATILAGGTRITFTAASGGPPPFYHFAFNIPENKFQLGKAWL